MVSREFFKDDHRRVEEKNSERRAMLYKVMIWPLLPLLSLVLACGAVMSVDQSKRALISASQESCSVLFTAFSIRDPTLM